MNNSGKYDFFTVLIHIKRKRKKKIEADKCRVSCIAKKSKLQASSAYRLKLKNISCVNCAIPKPKEKI